MRFRTSTLVTICVFTAGVTVAGCSPSSSGSSSAVPAAISSASPVSTAQAAAATCQPADLSLSLGAKSGDTGQQTLAVELTNKGSSACTMEGFPGVNLVGAANGKRDYTWPLLRSSASYSKVTLPPGGTAHFGLRYLPGVSGDGTNLAVAKIVITPPNDFTQAEVTWSQPVLLQDGATHPGTYITPVVSGS